MKNYCIDYLNNKEEIELAEECGLTLTGFKKGVPQYIGNNRAWSLFDDGGY